MSRCMTWNKWFLPLLWALVFLSSTGRAMIPTYKMHSALRNRKSEPNWPKSSSCLPGIAGNSEVVWTEWSPTRVPAPFLYNSLALLCPPLCVGFVLQPTRFTIERRSWAATMATWLLVPFQWKRVNSFHLNHEIKPFLHSDWINLVCFALPFPSENCSDWPRPRYWGE